MSKDMLVSMINIICENIDAIKRDGSRTISCHKFMNNINKTNPHTIYIQIDFDKSKV